MPGTTPPSIGIIMNGVSGRMGYRQHLLRSILAIREQGGVLLSDGSRVQVEPMLVGRSRGEAAPSSPRSTASSTSRTTSTRRSANPDFPIYADFLVTQARVDAIRKAIAAGKHIYTEKPTAESFADALDLARRAQDAGVKHGVVHDKLYLPGLQKLKRLIDSGFFGRILSVRGEFGYWVFEGDWQPAQRPSWNYRTEDGGGIVSDMFAHWNYVIENLFGRIESVYAVAVTHIPERWDEQGERYTATADDAAYGIFELENGTVVQLNSSWAVRVHRKELVEFQVDGTLGSAVVGLFGCEIQPRNATPKPVWNPDLQETHDYFADWIEVPDQRRLRERVQGAVGAVPAARARGCPIRLRPARRRPRGATERGGAALVARGAAHRPARGHALMTDLTLVGAERRRHDRRAVGRARVREARDPARPRGSPMRPRTSCRARPPRTCPAHPPTSTGMRPSRSATTSGRGASASPTRWTPRSATWGWTGRRAPSSSAGARPRPRPWEVRSSSASTPTT